MEMKFYLPTRIIVGEACVEKNASLLTNVGNKPLIVTGKSSAKACGALDDVIKALGKCEYVLFDGISQNPTVESCFEGAKLAINCGCDYIIGIGGGSPMDAAKAIAVICANPDIDEATLYSNKWEKSPFKTVTVGTTAGTGSEVTPVAVITDSKGRKKSVKGPLIFPVLSFGDYRYTLGLKENFVASTAVDALCHCVESFFNRTAEESCESFAIRGVELLYPALKKLADGSLEDLTSEDREMLYMGSIYGGLAISVTGTALCHAMGYFLTEDFGLSHGFACAAYFESFINLSCEADPLRAQSFFKRASVDKNELCQTVNKLSALYMPSFSKEKAECYTERWKDNASLKKSVFELSQADAESLVKKLFCK